MTVYGSTCRGDPSDPTHVEKIPEESKASVSLVGLCHENSPYKKRATFGLE